MTALDHAHPVDPRALEEARAGALTAGEVRRLESILALLADPVRVRLLFALLPVDELCVGDLALALGDVSDDQVSYALRLLRTAGLVQPRREGRIINYRLADGFPQELLEHCLRQLLTLTEPNDHTDVPKERP